MKVPDTDVNAQNCICDKGDCPTYNQGNLTGTLFCARGKADRIPQRGTCICDVCPVWAEYDLSDLDYCIDGAADER